MIDGPRFPLWLPSLADPACYHPTGSERARIEPHVTYHFRVTRDLFVSFFASKVKRVLRFQY